MKRNAIVVCCLVSLVSLAPSEAQEGKPKIIDGKAIFQQQCASCHTAGGNNLKPSAQVAESKQLTSLATFKAYLSVPPGHMPYYQNVVKDQSVLNALYKYCKTLKKQPTKRAML